MTPTFSVLIGSIGRPQLKNALDSIKRQNRIKGDSVYVGIDSFEFGDRPDVQELVRSYGEGFHVISFNSGYHWYGIEQINYIIRNCKLGSHVFTIGDDDVFVDGAYDVLRAFCTAHPEQPILYQFLSPDTPFHGGRMVLWDKPRMKRSYISGCCIAAPWQYVEEMPTGQYVEHDYDWMLGIIARAKLNGHLPVWLKYVGVIARPDAYGDDVVHKGVRTCWHCERWEYREYFNPLKVYCACGAVSDLADMRPRKVEGYVEA